MMIQVCEECTLRSILEAILLDPMFELSGLSGVSEIVINRDAASLIDGTGKTGAIIHQAGGASEMRTGIKHACAVTSCVIQPNRVAARPPASRPV
jgi:hypothetical protein